ncbi:MAG: hypothetical protein A2170_17070 [Deltaproteobacteria bacterium RBG_13_53_10]|nr:MAG: hypothetical protein A2170_17070 [Deltaproteobacteria bacterium RBG_13_53_10]
MGASRPTESGLHLFLTVPLVISVFANESDGRISGFLNSARFAGATLGPILGTSILAYSDPPRLFLFISLITLFALSGFKLFFKETDST